MKPITSLLLVIISLTLFACHQPAELTVKANERQELPENVNSVKPSNDLAEQNLQTSDLLVLKSENPVIFSGAVSIRNRQVVASDSVWVIVNDDILEKLNKEKTLTVNDKTSIKVDIMNCAGYLGSGTAHYDSGRGTGWKIQQMLTETIPADSLEKIKQCSGRSDLVIEDDTFIMNSAFAVESQSDKRRNIKVGKVDTRQLFAALPKDTRQWLNEKSNLSETGNREKGNLSTASGDNWTDLDGDGNIDLIEVSAHCGNFDCGSILYLMKGKWTEIGHWIPA